MGKDCMNWGKIFAAISRRYARSSLGTGADAVNGRGAQLSDYDEEVEKPPGRVSSGPAPLLTPDPEEERRQAELDSEATRLRAAIAESERKIAKLEAVIQKQNEAASEKEPAVDKASHIVASFNGSADAPIAVENLDIPPERLGRMTWVEYQAALKAADKRADAEHERRMAGHHANIERAKAKKAEADRKVRELRKNKTKNE